MEGGSVAVDVDGVPGAHPASDETGRPAGLVTASVRVAEVDARWRWRRWLRSGDEAALQLHKVPLPWIVRLFFIGIVSAIAAAGAWQLAGGSVRTITTPSMCPTMCVGQLIVDTPLVGSVHVGEVVTFRPPGFAADFTHRVVYVQPNGDFQTKGDGVDHRDPWIATPADVVGVVRHSVWGLGWINLALPFLAVGMVALLATRAMLRPTSRRTWDRLAATGIVVVPVWYLQPLVRGVALYTLPGTTRFQGVVKAVNTGLLPAQFAATHGATVPHVPSAHTALVQGPFLQDGMVHVSEIASLFWWEWVLVALVVFAPLLGYALRRARIGRLDLVVPTDLAEGDEATQEVGEAGDEEEGADDATAP